MSPLKTGKRFFFRDLKPFFFFETSSRRYRSLPRRPSDRPFKLFLLIFYLLIVGGKKRKFTEHPIFTFIFEERGSDSKFSHVLSVRLFFERFIILVFFSPVKARESRRAFSVVSDSFSL